MMLRSALVLASLSFSAAVAAAQGGSCVINTDRPADIIGVRARYGRLIDMNSNPGDKFRHYSQSIRALVEDHDNIDNQIARWYLLGKTYTAWLSLGEEGRIADFDVLMKKSISTRGESGFTLGDKKAKHDLFAALDSAFNRVEAMNPGCTDSTSAYRARVYLVVYNKARELLKAKNYDSVLALANRALVVDPKAAAPLNLIANAYFEKGDMPAYRIALMKVAAIPAGDSITNGIRLNALKNLGVMSLNEAKEKQGDTQKALAQDAIDRFKEYLKSRPDDPEVASGLSGALLIVGDTVESKRITDRMMANPAQFSAGALFAAATSAFTSGQYDIAIKFYEAGLVKNPYHRDGLFSLVSTLIRTGDFGRAIDVMRRVLELDPSNRNNFQQMASALQGAARATQDTARKARLQNEQLAFIFKRDSSATWAKVNQFDVTKDSISVEGEVHNMTGASRSQQINFEFLNASGAVVATASENVKDIPANKGMAFVITTKGTGVIAWRYKPLQ